MSDAIFGSTTGLGAGLSGVIIQEAPPVTGIREVPIVRIMAAPGRVFRLRLQSADVIV